MSIDWALDLIRSTAVVAATVSAPALLAALVVGVLVGMLQASTQVNEPSVTFLAKLLAVGVALAAAGPFLISRLVEFTRASIGSISTMIR